MRPEYLFVRVLEACNADCFMCAFARSRDPYRFGAAEMRTVLGRVAAEGVRYVRLTGGEPLIHREVREIVEEIAHHGLRASLITNGRLLAGRAPALRQAGLEQVIVSIDGLETTHDRLRGSPGLFARAIAGVACAVAAGLLVRVNTVCGPANFREMPALQDALTRLGVRQWELSSLKLDRPLDWPARDRDAVRATVRAVYEDGARAGKLTPTGKVWCGETPTERDRYFETGITPRADATCHVVRHVRYVDARFRRLFPCSLLAHRPDADAFAAPVGPWSEFSVAGAEIERQAERFGREGPHVCTGCSTTAAGYSNALAAGGGTEPWSF